MSVLCSKVLLLIFCTSFDDNPLEWNKACHSIRKYLKELLCCVKIKAMNVKRLFQILFSQIVRLPDECSAKRGYERCATKNYAPIPWRLSPIYHNLSKMFRDPLGVLQIGDKFGATIFWIRRRTKISNFCFFWTSRCSPQSDCFAPVKYRL